MRGAVLYGPRDVRFEEREVPKIIKPTDAIIRVSRHVFADPTSGRIVAFSRLLSQPRWATSTAASSRKSEAQ